MSLFEFLMVMVAIILGLGATQALRGLSRIARSKKPSAAVVMWAIALFYLYIQVWWAFWDLHAFDGWTQFLYYFQLAIPCAIFGATELLVPMGMQADADWREHFQQVRIWFYSVFSAVVILGILFSWVFFDVPFTHPYRLIQLLGLAIAITGLMVRRPSIHVWLATLYFFTLLSGQMLFRLLPQGLD